VLFIVYLLAPLAGDVGGGVQRQQAAVDRAVEGFTTMLVRRDDQPTSG
jgi:hypothetical protein